MSDRQAGDLDKPTSGDEVFGHLEVVSNVVAGQLNRGCSERPADGAIAGDDQIVADARGAAAGEFAPML